MTANEVRKVACKLPNAMADAAMEKHNAKTAEVDQKGDIWIEGPMRGHWMSDEELSELAEWIETDVGQSLSKWAGLTD